MRELQEAQENEENVTKSIREGHKKLMQESAAKRQFKGNAEQCMMKLCEVHEKNGRLIETKEAGFNIYLITYAI